MKRNSGFIGSKKSIKKSDGGGITELRDQHIHAQSNNWPDSPEMLSFSVENTQGSITALQLQSNENHTFTLSFKGLEGAHNLYWTVNSLKVWYFGSSGSFAVNNNSGTFTFATNFRGSYSDMDNGDTIYIRTGGVTGDIIGEIPIRVIRPFVSVTSYNVSEAGVGTSYLQYRLYYCGSRQTVYFQINSYSGAATRNVDYDSEASDNVALAMGNSGSATSRQQVYTDYITVADDFVTEGNEDITVNWGIFNSGSTTTFSTFSSATSAFTISDTTIASTPIVTTNANTINEGDTVTFTYTDSSNPNARVNWTLNTSGGASSADLAVSQGAFTLNGSGVANLSIIAASDFIHPETESFSIDFRANTSYSGPIIATSPTVTITSVTPPTVVTDFIPINTTAGGGSGGYVAMLSSADYVGSYNLFQVTVPSTFSGSARIYIGGKVTASTTYYNDHTVAGIQILNSTGTSILRADIFSSGTESYETTTVETAALSTAGQYPISLSTATGLTYSAIASGSTARRWNLATSTGSTYTGMADGISTTYETGLLPTPTNSTYQVPQASSTNYVYMETSGSVRYRGMTMRSPAYNFSGGEIIRICFQLTSRSGYGLDADGSLFIGVA